MHKVSLNVCDAGLRPALVVIALCLAPLPARASQDVFPPPSIPLALAAARTTAPLTIDGVLAEADWQRAVPAAGFVQAEPHQGERAVLDTEVRVLFDTDALYVGIVCHDPLVETNLRVKDLRRDFDTTTDDVVGVSVDPFRDRQNAMAFLTNPAGAQLDLLVRDNGVSDFDWDAVWTVRTSVSNDGWTAEMAIPWKTLRYPAGQSTWGVNFLRITHRLQETSGWSPWPRQYSPFRMMYAGVLTGLEPPAPSMNLRIVPYATMNASSMATDSGSTATRSSKVGGDLKWAMSPTTVLDGTINTDFAQADVDRQVINLTRFSVLFPERRQFFLENAGLFTAGISQEFLPFFSRRIGLDADGTPVPIDAGVRLTTRSRDQSAGVLAVRQGPSGTLDSSTFVVGRYIRNLPRQSRMGAVVVSRFDTSGGLTPSAANTVGGLDWYINFSPTVYVRGMISGSTTTGGHGNGLAGSVDLSHEGNRVVAWWVEEFVGPGYTASTGFVQRPDLIRADPGLLLDLRPNWRPNGIRDFRVGSYADVFHRASDGTFQEAEWFIRLLNPIFRNGASFQIAITPTWQQLNAPFQPLTNITIAPGRYQYNRWDFTATSDPSTRLGGKADLTTGAFYDGRLDVLTLQGRASVGPRLAFAGSYERDALRRVGGTGSETTTHLFAPELRAAVNPRLKINAFYQYNTAVHDFTLNARFSWEFKPLSYLYIVYNGFRPIGELTQPRSSEPTGRQFVIKLAWLKQL